MALSDFNESSPDLEILPNDLARSSVDELSETPRNLSSDDEDGDIVLSPKRQLFKAKVCEATPKSITPSSDDENSDFSPSTSLSTSRSPTSNVFARYRYENTKKKDCIKTRERRQ